MKEPSRWSHHEYDGDSELWNVLLMLKATIRSN